MITGRGGVAALFDALVFLAVASVVSVAVLSALAGQGAGVNGGQQGRVEAAHLVLLRSTLADWSGNRYTVEELFGEGPVTERGYDENITEILDLLLSGMGWRWTVERGAEHHALGASPGDGGTMYCSTVLVPTGEGEAVFRLEAWAA